jgi:hypothetical protein
MVRPVVVPSQWSRIPLRSAVGILGTRAQGVPYRRARDSFRVVKRRLASALLGLLFINAAVIGSTPGCAARERGEHSRHDQAGQHGLHGVVAAGANTAADVPSGGEHQSSQCDMAMACSFVASVGEVAELPETLPVVRHAVWAHVAAPHSVHAAPEPPPPRA